MAQVKRVSINSRNYDGSIRRTWKCRLVDRKDPLLVFVGTFDEAVEHPDLGSIAKETVSFEYYWLDRWYNVFRFHEPNGTLRNFYCNVNMPPKFDGSVLDYVDLDVDLIVWPDGRMITLDEEDFEENAAKFDYPPEIRRYAYDSVGELRKMIAAREFPFDTL